MIGSPISPQARLHIAATWGIEKSPIWSYSSRLPDGPTTLARWRQPLEPLTKGSRGTKPRFNPFEDDDEENALNNHQSKPVESAPLPSSPVLGEATAARTAYEASPDIIPPPPARPESNNDFLRNVFLYGTAKALAMLSDCSPTSTEHVEPNPVSRFTMGCPDGPIYSDSTDGSRGSSSPLSSEHATSSWYGSQSSSAVGSTLSSPDNDTTSTGESASRTRNLEGSPEQVYHSFFYPKTTFGSDETAYDVYREIIQSYAVPPFYNCLEREASLGGPCFSAPVEDATPSPALQPTMMDDEPFIHSPVVCPDTPILQPISLPGSAATWSCDSLPDCDDEFSDLEDQSSLLLSLLQDEADD